MVRVTHRTVYQCSYCGSFFVWKDECEKHESRYCDKTELLPMEDLDTVKERGI